MESIILTEELVVNKDRKFGSQNVYYPVRIKIDNKLHNALFTVNQLDIAINRALKNNEDIDEGNVSFWDWIIEG